MIGRLKAGISVEQAQAELDILSERIRLRHNRDQLRFKVGLLDNHISGRLRPALLVLVLRGRRWLC